MKMAANAPLKARTSAVRRPTLQRKCACGQHTVGGGECASCRKKKTRLQRAAAGSAAVSVAPPIVHEVLRSPGRPLDRETRAFMEPRFGHDLSRVRVHTGTTAAESARAVNARAYTVGSEVVFGAGEFRPETLSGRRLLAHELAHVTQASVSQPSSRVTIVAEADPSERYAEAAADQVVGGGALTGHDPGFASPMKGLARYAAGGGPLLSPEAIKVFEYLVRQFTTQSQAGALVEAEAAEATAAVADAEAAVTTAVELAGAGAGAGTGLTAAGEASLLAAGGTIEAPPVAAFFAIGGLVLLGIGAAVVWSYKDDIAAAWDKATQAVQKAVDLIQKALSSKAQPTTHATTQTQNQPLSQTQQDVTQEEGQSCQVFAPNLKECWELEDFGYEYHGQDLKKARAATLADLRRNNEGNLQQRNVDEPTSKGPCPGLGTHTYVYDASMPTDSNRVGSIVCCPCCIQEESASLEARCGVV